MKRDNLMENLKNLRLNTIAKEYSTTALQCEKERKSFEQYLAQLIQLEITAKNDKKVMKLIHSAKFPKNKTLDSYNFSNRKGITAQQIQRLSDGRFLDEATNIVFYGTFGVGKSHLAEGLGRKLCELGYSCYYTTASTLINELMVANQNLTLANVLKRIDKYDLLIIDELGYTPHGKEGADLFFQLISQRYERKSVLFTTNLTYSEWDQVFINKTTTAAAVDRIIHKCETFNIEGPSQRAEDAKKNVKK